MCRNNIPVPFYIYILKNKCTTNVRYIAKYVCVHKLPAKLDQSFCLYA